MYINKDTLSTRISIHDKYSVNKYGWSNWVFDQYKIEENINILELGCGTGITWTNNSSKLPKNVNITLSDISPLMIEKVKEKFGNNQQFKFSAIDIQEIPFEDNTFDIIIANHMLYHVSDICKALSEVKRTLKNNEIFYATTVGENSLQELQDIYKTFQDRAEFSFATNLSFTLENGENVLNKYFTKIEKDYYIDSLEVTDTKDLMDYITSYNKIPEKVFSEIYEIINNKINKNGIFKIRKDQGIFKSRK